MYSLHIQGSRQRDREGFCGTRSIGYFRQWLGAEIDADFIILDPIQHDCISLQLMLWLALLVGFFLPVRQNRVPSMPIGLGFTLLLIPNPGSMIAWCLGIMAFIYMLTQPQTRRWFGLDIHWHHVLLGLQVAGVRLTIWS